MSASYLCRQKMVQTTDYIFLLEMNSVSAHSAGAYTTILYVMVNCVKMGGRAARAARAPPTLTNLG